MILPLPGGNREESEAVRRYCDDVAAARAAPGIPLFPPIFDLDDMGT